LLVVVFMLGRRNAKAEIYIDRIEITFSRLS
jgi:hypothetical protein